MGFSPLHASTVALARNLSTGHISPQFHVVYDDYFETVHSNGDDPPDEWNELVTVQSLHSNIDEDDPDHLPELADEWLNPAELADRHRRLIDKKISVSETKTQDKPTRDGILPNPPCLPPESKTTQATYPIPEDEAFFDASSEEETDDVPEEVSSSHIQKDHPSSQIIPSSYINESGLRRSLRRPDLRRYGNMAQHSIRVSRILMVRSICHFIEDPTDMNFACSSARSRVWIAGWNRSWKGKC
jgi:hypothetical protein